MDTENKCNEEKQEYPIEYLKEILSGDNNDSEVILDPINIDISNLEKIKFDYKKFQEGINDYSYLAGIVTALKNVGLTNDFILAYLTTADLMKTNIKIAEINRNADIEVSKNQAILMSKNQL